jgi:hypothetical protein
MSHLISRLPTARAGEGVFVLNSDYDFEKGQAALERGKADANNPEVGKRGA